MEWSEDRVAELRHLVARGLSASMIARHMRVTRNAIIGKCHRLGLRLGVIADDEPAGEVQAAPPALTVAETVAPSEPPARAPEPAPTLPETHSVEALFKAPDDPVEEIPAGGVTILDLREHRCRFILGPVAGLDTLYCGQPCEVGASWCAAHTIACEDQGHPNRGRKGIGGSWKKSAISEFRI